MMMMKQFTACVGCSYKVTKNAPLRENDVDGSQASDVSFIEQDENVILLSK